MSTPPLIGLTTYREQAAWGVWNQHADLLHVQYADGVVAAGGVPVLLPPATDAPEAADAVLERLDALVISGGADVDPGRYGADPHQQTANWRPERDAWELALLDAAAAAELPVLGICRGMQVMAVHAGGVLDQHTPDLVGHDDHSPGGDSFGHTQVTTTRGSRAQQLLGDSVVVSCHHHQSVRAAPGFAISAVAGDEIPEAIELPGERFCLGVQRHPEVRTELQLMLGLVEAARAR